MSNLGEIHEHTNNIYKSINTLNNLDANTCKAHDSITGKILNCSVPQKTPSQIAVTEAYTKTSKPTLEAYLNLARGNCPSTFIESKSKCPIIISRITKEFNIFIKLFINNISGNLTSRDLVPVLNDKTVTCPDGYIPYVLEYSMAFKDYRFSRFCAKKTQINSIRFNDIGDYSIHRYIEKNTNLPCETTNCNTKYEAFLGHNNEDEPLYSEKSSRNSNIRTDIIIGVVIGIVFLIIIIVVMVEKYKVRKPKMSINK